ncbi:MAG: TolC family protein [Candidatus Aphodosoma sp.]
MNNFRLLTGLFLAALSGGGVCSYGQRTITLEEIFQTAEANSTQLRPSITAQTEAACAESVARAGRLPDINISLSASYIGDGFTTKRDFSDYQRAPIPHFGNGLSVNVSQPLYTGGAVTNAVKLAESEQTSSRYAADFQRDNIRFRLTGLYLDIYRYTNLRKVTESNLDAARQVLKEMQARHEHGTAIKNDITRYELLVSDLELQLIKTDNTITLLNSTLVTTAGLPAGTVVIPDSTILVQSLPINEEAWWQQEATDNSPSLNIARSGVDISRKAENIARSEYFPKIGIQAGWSMDGPILVEIPPVNRNLSYWYVGVGISYNLSSLYKADRTLAKSRASTRRTMEELDIAKENISLAVKADYIRYLEAYEELKTRQKSAELARRNYRTVLTRYSADMALITDMLDAANAKLDAEERLANAHIDIIYHYYKLLFTTGKI